MSACKVPERYKTPLEEKLPECQRLITYCSPVQGTCIDFLCELSIFREARLKFVRKLSQRLVCPNLQVMRQSSIAVGSPGCDCRVDVSLRQP